MENTYIKRSVFTALMAVSFIFGAVFFVTNHFDFCIKAIETGHLNMSNLAYILIHFIDVLLIPAVFIVHPNFYSGRVKSAKILFIILGALHLAALSWIIYFLGNNPFADFFSAAKTSAFQSDPNYAFVYNYVTWDTYNPAGSLFTLIYGILCIFTGIDFDDNRVRVRRRIITLAALRLLFPLINNVIFQGRIYSMFWITNNYAVILSYMAFTAAIVLASLSDNVWVECVWDTPPADPDSDDDLFN